MDLDLHVSHDDGVWSQQLCLRFTHVQTFLDSVIEQVEDCILGLDDTGMRDCYW